MRKRLAASALAAAATVVLFGSISATPAMADGGGGGGGGRPCGPPSMASGTGTLGSPFTLKSMYDDDGPVQGAVVVGEEFEIKTQAAGQVWTVTFSDNGTTFFSGDVTSTVDGIRVVKMNSYQGGTSHMAAHAVSQSTGEVVDSAVDLPVAPPGCAGH